MPAPSAKIVYYFVKWCPHCKKATPEWNSIKDEFNNKEVNGTRVEFEEVDCEKNDENKNSLTQTRGKARATMRNFQIISNLNLRLKEIIL